MKSKKKKVPNFGGRIWRGEQTRIFPPQPNGVSHIILTSTEGAAAAKSWSMTVYPSNADGSYLHLDALPAHGAHIEV